jgi:dihydrofolate reductase
LIISLIAAIDIKGGIGKDNRLPWHLQMDIKRFKSLTMGHHIVMGRKTFESIGKLLPGRTMVVVTRNPKYQPIGCIIAKSIEDALEIVKKNHETEVFIIGGGEIFKQAMDLADKIYLTRVNTDAYADVFFPNIEPSIWKLTYYKEIASDKQNEYASMFSIFIRIDHRKDIN